MKAGQCIWASLRRGWESLVSRRLYTAMFLIVPLMSLFFLSLLSEGLPVKIPVAVVDLDQSTLSRQVTRSLASSQMLSVDEVPENYATALDDVRNGRIYGFFHIPEDFQRDTYAGRQPTLTFYSNMTYFVPGTLSFKGFKTVAVATTGNVAATKIVATGVVGTDAARSLMQPVVVDSHALHNPWLNYSVYLSNSFIPGVLALMVMLMTAWAVCDEIKRRTSPGWLATAGGSMVVALFGKLFPQTLIWSAIGVAMQAVLYGFCGFPLFNHAAHMIVAMVLLVVGCQAFSLIICEMLPNLRLALSINSLLGILSFSVTGFSFPVEDMYGAIGVFSYIIPLRWYFLIYIDQALNGIPLYYSRIYYALLLVFPLVAFVGLRRLKKKCLNPVNVP